MTRIANDVLDGDVLDRGVLAEFRGFDLRVENLCAPSG